MVMMVGVSPLMVTMIGGRGGVPVNCDDDRGVPVK